MRDLLFAATHTHKFDGSLTSDSHKITQIDGLIDSILGTTSKPTRVQLRPSY